MRERSLLDAQPRAGASPAPTVALLIAAVLYSSSAAAQGFLPPEGTIWVKVGYTSWSADERYAGPFNPEDLRYDGGTEPGTAIPIKLDSEGSSFSSLSLGLNLQIVPIERFVIGAYFPVYQVSEFTQSDIVTTTTGTGDVFAYLGYQLTPEGIDIGNTMFLHLKLPTTEAELEDLSVPLSEGQLDLALESATTWALLPNLHLTGRLLYRWRTEATSQVGDVTARIKPGNETEVGIELGGAPTSWLWIRGGYRGLFASTQEDRTVANDILALEQRQIQSLEAGVYFQFGHWISPAIAGLALDTWYRHPVAGVDYLRGGMFGVGLAYGVNWHN